MGIESPYIGLYGVWSMVGIEVGGMGVVWVLLGCGMGWSMEVQGISNPDCNILLRQNPARLNPRRTVSDDCSYSTPRTPWAVIWDDIVCRTIRYHENDTLASKTAFKSS